MKSYISPNAQKGLKSKIHGRGLLAINPIKAGEVVAIKGGRKLTKNELKQTGISGHAELQIADDLYIAPSTKEELEDSMIFINHSCAPNVGMKDAVTFVAMRDINRGEELTIDYAMLDDNDFKMDCICGSANCRKIVSGKDWMKIELQKRYRGYFAPFISAKINH